MSAAKVTAFPRRSPVTLLVLEDEALTRCLISDELRTRGYKVVETASVEEARAVMATLRLDLAFLDIHMSSGPSGVALAEWIRTHHPSTKLILTSGKVDPSSLPDLSGLGPFLVKPYPFSRVVELVARCLEPPGNSAR